jgi:acyl carrier protein
MAAGDASTASRVERTGMALLMPSQGVAILEGMLVTSSTTAPAQLAATPFVWAKFLPRFGPAVPALFAEFTSAAEGESSMGAAASGGRAVGKRRGSGAPKPSSGLSAADRKAAVLGQVQEAVKSIVGGAVSPDEPLMAAGLDSLGAVELKNSLEGRLGMQLPGTLVFDYPTITALAGYLETVLLAGEASEDGESAGFDGEASYELAALSPRQGLAAAASVAGSGAITVLGLASRTAQDAILSPSPLDIISPVPLEHWDVDLLGRSGGLPPRFGGFLRQTDLFDAAVFGLSSGEADLMDAQQRMLLEASVEVRLACCH